MSHHFTPQMQHHNYALQATLAKCIKPVPRSFSIIRLYTILTIIKYQSISITKQDGLYIKLKTQETILQIADSTHPFLLLNALQAIHSKLQHHKIFTTCTEIAILQAH